MTFLSRSRARRGYDVWSFGRRYSTAGPGPVRCAAVPHYRDPMHPGTRIFRRRPRSTLQRCARTIGWGEERKWGHVRYLGISDSAATAYCSQTNSNVCPVPEFWVWVIVLHRSFGELFWIMKGERSRQEQIQASSNIACFFFLDCSIKQETKTQTCIQERKVRDKHKCRRTQ